MNEFRSLFDRFERLRPSTVFNNGSNNNSHTNQSQPVSSRTRNKLLQCHPIPYRAHDVIQTECNCVLDSAIPVQKPKHFTDTLTSQHASYWKLAAFEHFDQNAHDIFCYIPFPISQVLVQYKIHKHVLVPSVKTDYKLPNYYDLKMRWCQNGNADANNK